MNPSNVIIEPKGSLDINSSETLRREIVDLLDRRGATSILIDCREVSFMDSSGLSALVMALKLSKEANKTLALCSVGAQASLLFQLTGMNQVFDIFEDRAAFEQTISQPA